MPGAAPTQRVRHPRVRVRDTTFRFSVAHPGPIEIVVRAIAPRCRVVGTFVVDARRGSNSFSLSAGVLGSRLDPGAYAVVARRGATTLFRQRLFVGARVNPSPGACAAVSRERSPRTSGPSPKRAFGQAARARRRRSGVLSARVSRSATGSGETQAALLIILAAATALLAIAALPRQLAANTAVGTFVARRRAPVAAAGVAALVAFLVSYFLA